MEILRLMGHCNNNCIFCMVESEIKSSNDIPLNTLLDRLEKVPEGTVVDLFGGEPTLYPHFFELIQFLSEKNISYEIASNGKLFKERKFAERVLQYKPTRVRTSIYGDNAQTHDLLTQTKGSFDDTIKGIQNLIDIGINVSVNYVIFTENIKQIFKATKLLENMGVNSFKFSLPIMTSKFLYLIADIKNVRCCLMPTLNYLNKLNIKFEIEKAPFCLAPKYIKFYLMESSPEMIQSIPKIFMKTKVCTGCLLEPYCNGVDIGYFERYAESGIYPLELKDLPQNFVQIVSFENLLTKNVKDNFSLFHLFDEEKLLEPDNIAKFIKLFDNKRKSGQIIGLI